MTTKLDTHTLDTSGATLTYDVRGEAGTAGADHPVLLLIGSPMDAVGFTTLASHFTDRVVVTYDPRGTGRSVRTDGKGELTPEVHADDLRQLIEALGVGAVDVFASSGGAVNGLALVARHPGLVRTLVAHEPPAVRTVPDHEQAWAAVEDIHRTYRRDGMGPAMAKFIALTMQKGPLPDGYADAPAPDPVAFGLPAEDDGSRDDALLGQNLRGCCGYRPDFDALAAAPTRIVVAVGTESEGELAARAGVAVAERLGLSPEVFPSHHGGFLGGEYGQHGEPEPFAAKLREVLATT
ncbi:alpha/beta fold hydrolase [Streptomyces sp. NRRL B-1347]|uniref:alpha/beta fold hydrolase n=1 Tax=Streptomyces sp. NRRL B-1347 TaxID=1476877 RepID=UPI0004C66B2A|nr:alpha/beta fold hydrolase [Streptomyces sp. NRRL B-1347]